MDGIDRQVESAATTRWVVRHSKSGEFYTPGVPRWSSNFNRAKFFTTKGAAASVAKGNYGGHYSWEKKGGHEVLPVSCLMMVFHGEEGGE